MVQRVEHDPCEGHHVQTSRSTALQGGPVALLDPHARVCYADNGRLASVRPSGEGTQMSARYRSRYGRGKRA
eukprot:10813980-Heterocapsa_arctica.AAC.1